jgi:DMSO/TMAO reductase YedYZ molybdopterin-dependent catalytic subunit
MMGREEGWYSIAEWTGVPLRRVLEAAGALPSARFVTFQAFDDVADSIDVVDALHPQTILAYGMNGRDLPVGHGAPVRVRIERRLVTWHASLPKNRVFYSRNP